MTMRWRCLRFGSLLGAALVPAIAFAEPVDFVREDPGPQHIYGGNPVGACEWPTTVSLGGCTGTLVHPEVIIYAAHCGSVGEVFFGDSVYGQGRSVYPEFCRTYPGGGPGGGTDWAFCKLSEPVTDIAITPPLMGCETDLLVQGAEVWIVGFGNTDDGNFGVKYEAKTVFNYIQNDEAFIGGNGIDTCQGDSGGPVYIQVGDGSWRAFGITSYGDGCGGGGWYSMMHTGMAWFESESGVDITPCHDADGTWNPGPDCKGFPLQPMTATGSWPNGCDGGPVSEWSDTCGAPYLAEDDVDPPTVRIVSPTDGEQLASMGAKAEVSVRIEADDGGGSGIREVQLVLDGNALMAADTAAPYQFTLQLGSGVYGLEAIAVDHGDNSSTSALVTIGIDEAPPGPGGGSGAPPDGGDDGASDGDGSDAEGDDGEPEGGGLGGGALPPGFGADALPSTCGCRHDGAPLSAFACVLGLLALRRRRVGTLARDETCARARRDLARRCVLDRGGALRSRGRARGAVAAARARGRAHA